MESRCRSAARFSLSLLLFEVGFWAFGFGGVLLVLLGELGRGLRVGQHGGAHQDHQFRAGLVHRGGPEQERRGQDVLEQRHAGLGVPLEARM